ncbi:MAG: biotin--[acetyl-CoA-carboxylase] ligase [Microscillaceae bacterium]
MDNFSFNTLIIGQKFIDLPNCHSTNDIAQQIIREGQPEEGLVIYTEHQTAGRGQRGNHWEAAPGQNLTFSVILSPQFLAADQQFYLSMAVALAVRKALLPYCAPQTLKIKWPNDLFVEQKKIGGILIENTLRHDRLQYAVVGIGINVNQENFAHPRATSLRKIRGENTPLKKLLWEILWNLEQEYLRLQNSPLEITKNEYLASLFRWKSWHLYQIQGQYQEACIIDVGPGGHLWVQIGTEMRALDFKEIVFLFEEKP